MNEATLVNTTKITPSVSIIFSTDKSYPQYLTDQKRLDSLLKQVENELTEKFSEVQSKPVIERLEKLIESIDHQHLSKAIAIFASPEKERIVYLPFSIEEKFIIDSSFEVRDLLYSINKNVDYLVVLIDSHNPEIYYGYNTVLVKAKIDELPSGIEDVERDYASRVSNFSDPNAVKEVNLDKYLREIDHVITDLYQQMNIPIVICGVERSIGHFKKITKNGKHIVDYIVGNYQHASKEEIYKAVEAFIFEKGENDQQKIMDTLDKAVSRKQYVTGIENVWRAAAEQRGERLIVEKDYSCKAVLGSDKYTLITEGFDPNEPFVIQDAVDDLIELVLKNGGEISFVNNGKLIDYEGVVLVTYY